MLCLLMTFPVQREHVDVKKQEARNGTLRHTTFNYVEQYMSVLTLKLRPDYNKQTKFR